MKKFLVLSLLLCTNICFAEEIQTNQTVQVEDTKATIAVLKKPGNPDSKQDARIKNVWFSIVVVCDGKIKQEQ